MPKYDTAVARDENLASEIVSSNNDTPGPQNLRED